MKKRFKELGGTINCQRRVVSPSTANCKAAQDAVDRRSDDSEQKSKRPATQPTTKPKRNCKKRRLGPNRKYELAKITFERLKAECISVTNEADGLDIDRFELNFLAEGRYFEYTSSHHRRSLHAARCTSASRLERAFRLALLVVTFAVCCYVAYGFGRWWALAQQSAPPLRPSHRTRADLDPLAAALPLGGQWAFDELDWSLQSRTRRSEAARRRVRAARSSRRYRNSTRSCPTPIRS